MRKMMASGLWTLCAGLAAATIVVPASPALAAFPGANGKIAFVSTDGGFSQIHTISADGTGEVNVTDDPSASYSQPAWSPDGTKLAFVKSSPQEDNDVYVMDADGSHVTRLTKDGALDGFPAWSPDGSRIAFVSQRSGYWNIWVMNADGSKVRNLTHDSTFNIDPAWSPDGAKIAFASIRGRNQQNDIYTMNADGSGVQRLTSTKQSDRYPAWSPDGARIAYTKFGYQLGPHIRVMNVDGTGSTALAPGMHPAWSPDGAEIAFVGTSLKVFVATATGANSHSISSGGVTQYGLDWGAMA
jgi:tol-pal system beta propeller repeat protein TolB